MEFAKYSEDTHRKESEEEAEKKRQSLVNQLKSREIEKKNVPVVQEADYKPEEELEMELVEPTDEEEREEELQIMENTEGKDDSRADEDANDEGNVFEESEDKRSTQ